MKFLIIAICAIAAVTANPDKGYDITKIPGCENFNKYKSTNLTVCCPSLPKVFKRDSHEACEKECKGKGRCCVVDCDLKAQNLVDSTGKFDPTQAKVTIKGLLNNANYPVDSIVDNCVSKAPAAVAQWKKNNPEKAAKVNATACPNPENFSIPQCIKHDMVENCDTWAKTPDCEALMGFVKTCPIYPSCGGKHGKGGEGKKEKKEKKN